VLYAIAILLSVEMMLSLRLEDRRSMAAGPAANGPEMAVTGVSPLPLPLPRPLTDDFD
jgi:hypothetical protein